eukprot:TRINITY_DN58132_c0_g1_i1.p1 TRINITY_DN58132_c0_g1~~TRINITY_DN58132_c0_g1_i1.p1  ORF type:complete len:344 (+),score=52.02 TRINITY_DN58132_c0_g1_i1:120-1151(+)
MMVLPSVPDPSAGADSEEDAAALEAIAVMIINADFGDMVRTGRLTLNSEVVAWKLVGTRSVDCRTFVRTVWESFLRAGQNIGLDDMAVLRRAIFIACKATSSEYIVACFYKRLRDLVGDVKINSASLRYIVDLAPGPEMHVRLQWSTPDNVCETCPCIETGLCEVKGSLRSLGTRFEFPPQPGCRPTYDIDFVALDEHRNEANWNPVAATLLKPDHDLEPAVGGMVSTAENLSILPSPASPAVQTVDEAVDSVWSNCSDIDIERGSFPPCGSIIASEGLARLFLSVYGVVSVILHRLFGGCNRAAANGGESRCRWQSTWPRWRCLARWTSCCWGRSTTVALAS